MSVSPDQLAHLSRSPIILVHFEVLTLADFTPAFCDWRRHAVHEPRLAELKIREEK